MDLYTITFAGNDLNAIIGADVYNHNFNDLPSRDIKINKLARQDQSIITSSEYSSKKVTINLKVCGGDRLSTESVITQLKSALQTQNSPLIVNQGGFKVEYTATLNEFQIQWIGATALITAGFVASDPIGKAVNAVPLVIATGKTTSIVSMPITVLGSAEAKPIITVVINAVTGATTKSISITNGNTTQGITITRTWIAGDVLIVDSFLMQASINGVITDFSGIFPMFKPGAQQIKYVDSFTTRTVDISATYKPRVV